MHGRRWGAPGFAERQSREDGTDLLGLPRPECDRQRYLGLSLSTAGSHAEREQDVLLLLDVFQAFPLTTGRYARVPWLFVLVPRPKLDIIKGYEETTEYIRHYILNPPRPAKILGTEDLQSKRSPVQRLIDWVTNKFYFPS
jgi:hypothetical protein